MKKLCVFLLAICLTSIACKKENKPNLYIINEEITMQILPKVVSINSSNILRIENPTQKDMFYGVDFSLEYFEENNWVPIPLEGTMWELIGIILYAGEETETEIDLYPFVEKYNNSTKGRYRIIKNGGLFLNFPFGNQSGRIDLYAEFDVE